MHPKSKQKLTTLRRKVYFFFFLVVVAVPFSAKADYKSEIIESCLNYQSGVDKDHVNACKLYIDGFIDAAVSTESAKIVDENSKQKSEEQSPFMKRVYQTRAIRRTSTQNNDVDYQFCLSTDQDRKDIASRIAKSLDVSDLESKTLKKTLSETLSKTFPCDQ